MKLEQHKFTYKVYNNRDELTKDNAELLQKSISELNNAYSPYSNFQVAATVLLANGKTCTGTNQENAAYPAGICAEGTALSVAASLYPAVPIVKIAITARSKNQVLTHPVAPCGICRQRLLEYESRFSNHIEVIIAAETGKVFEVNSVKDLMPLHFSNADL